MPIQQYVKRIQKHFLCSPACFAIALVYIDRLGKNNASMVVCDVTIHRLFAVAAMVAAKFHDDNYYSNAHYSKAAGLSLREVNLLEAVLLRELKWEVLVAVEEYELYYNLCI